MIHYNIQINTPNDYFNFVAWDQEPSNKQIRRYVENEVKKYKLSAFGMSRFVLFITSQRILLLRLLERDQIWKKVIGSTEGENRHRIVWNIPKYIVFFSTRD